MKRQPAMKGEEKKIKLKNVVVLAEKKDEKRYKKNVAILEHQSKKKK
jgi:hypothetical protein